MLNRVTGKHPIDMSNDELWIQIHRKN